VVPDGKKAKLMLNEDVLADWNKLTPAECYFSLLQAFYYRADAAMLGKDKVFLIRHAFTSACYFSRNI